MHDQQLLRYSRHILLDEIGIEGQEKIHQAHCLIIGAGGLGSSASLYLASAGVGCLTLVDNDVVDLTNLQRQIVHSTARIGLPKVQSAQMGLAAINPEIRIIALQERALGDRLDALVQSADVILDCSDNFATRHAINQACVRWAKPLVSGAAIQFDGQISSFDTQQDDAPCYACLFPPNEAQLDAHCASMGVFAPLVGIIGSMQAAEALKLIIGASAGQALIGRLFMLDARTMQAHEMKFKRDRDCPVCANRSSM